MVRKYLPNEHRKYLTESQYKTCMNVLGYTYDEELGRFFKENNAFLGNLSDDVTEVGELMKINENGYPTYMAKSICDFMDRGAELAIGEGAIDLTGKKFKKALYCTNYRELFSDKKMVRSK